LEVVLKRKKKKSGKKKKTAAIASPEASQETSGEMADNNTAAGKRVRVPFLILYGVKDIRTLALSLTSEIGDDFKFDDRRTSIQLIVLSREHHEGAVGVLDRLQIRFYSQP
jgi:hypothetical protein